VTRDIEDKATERARKVDTTLLPFKSSATDWLTWINDAGQWMFIEKAVVAAAATHYGYEFDAAFKWVGQTILDWLQKPENAIRPREIWNFNFRGGFSVKFGAFQNQCFVFMPR
jgi:hypothetical protein